MRLWENLKMKVEGVWWKRSKKGIDKPVEPVQPKAEPKKVEASETPSPENKQGER